MTDNTAPKFIDQLRIQLRVIWALTLREMITRYGREGIGIIWIIAEPAMFIVGVMIIFSAAGHSEFTGTTVAEYLAVSYPTLLLWRNGTGRVVKAVDINRALLHHRPVRPTDIIYSRILLEFSSATASFLILYLIFVAIGICEWPANLLTMITGYIMVVWFSFSFVLFMAALSELSEAIERVSHIILYLNLPFSGVFITAAAVPEPYRDYLLLFPLVNCVEWFHDGYYGDRLPTYYNPEYTIIMLLLTTLISYALTNIANRRVQST
ncbi:ABC transporter permease [Halothiobacillus diazotrophicus]|uniref:ABC transporter permease n=1 Tax=Halothiobacillus diazotrophicus TaxID=1860122 RepID=UPI0009EF539A|nr:ABC transporter permease [Halothiobacillus diazotrophicus]